MKSSTKFAVGVGLCLALLVALAAPAAAVDRAFPKPAQYVLHSNPHFVITVGENKELVACKAELILNTGEPYLASNGKRHVDLQIVDWHAVGTSKLLGGEIKFRMRKGATTTEKSFVESYEVSQTGSHDFPAQAQFAMPYELDTPFGSVSNLYGVTMGTIEAFPPQPGAQFKMQKGDVAHLMAQLMPAALSSMSAAGEVTAVDATIEPDACLEIK
ncbi:MAG: hypothetical protein WAM82_34810 [Thermoanaerobaculia bacterium]